MMNQSHSAEGSPQMRRKLQHNPYVDSFPQTHLSPYAISDERHSSWLARRLGAKHPQRTTKTAQKMVLLPAQDNEASESLEPQDIELNESVTLTADHEIARTLAERMSKEQRFLLPRVTSYCSADAYDLSQIAAWVRSAHAIVPKTYDEALYICYQPHAWPNYAWGSASLKWMTVALAKDNKNTELSFDPRFIAQDDTELPLWMLRREAFVFDYGVVVLWNFTAEEEQRYLESLRPFAKYPSSPEDAEIESLHFQYDLKGPVHPRIFNDMITLKSGNPLIKLTISHAIAQSTKLLHFENMIEYTIEDAIDFPKMMAKYGEVNIPRDEIMKVVGKLFQLRMDVNLISNVLDAPEIFWSETELEQFYTAIRGYMEITPRVAVLNTKTIVINDLVDMLSDHANSNQMHYITWIIIALICVAVVVAACEVWVKSLRISE